MGGARAGKTTSLSTSEDSSSRVTAFQARLAEEGERILTCELANKINKLDEICLKDIWHISRISEVRAETQAALDGYLQEAEALREEQEAAGGGGNPLLQLFGGGMSGKVDDADAEAEEGPVANPSKLLLSSIKLSESNKINLSLSLELEKKEKTSKSDDKEAEKASEEDTAEDKQSTDEEPPAKKSKKDSSTSKQEKQDEEDQPEDEEEKKTEEPTLKIHSIINELIDYIKPEIDEIVSWMTTLRAWMLANIGRNKNLGGADINAECQAVIIEEIKGIEDEFSAYKEQISAYYLARSTVLEKYIKAPEFEDMKYFILDEDEKMFVTLRNTMMALRNQTMNLYDAIEKDMDRLFPEDQDSRSANFSMY